MEFCANCGVLSVKDGTCYMCKTKYANGVGNQMVKKERRDDWSDQLYKKRDPDFKTHKKQTPPK